VINVDEEALHVIGKLAREGRSALYHLKMCLLQDMAAEIELMQTASVVSQELNTEAIRSLPHAKAQMVC
jgi:hypothetical protein